MPPPIDDWSDSDGDDLPTGVESNVLLGVPDGPVSDIDDVRDAAVSRIGGHPAFLPSREPPFDSSLCKVCNSPMHLLLQIWCPFEDSPMDRALYVWGCSHGTCQKKDGSIRAWRGLRFNEKYAAKLEKKLAKKRERERAKAQAAATEQAKKAAPKANPFSISALAAAPPSNPFALGNQIFKDAPSPPSVTVSTSEDEVEDDDGSSEESDDSEKSLVVALASTTLEDSPWKAAPSYLPLYLSTASEYLTPQTKPKLPPNVQVVDPDVQNKGDSSWASEAYENSLEVDNIFEIFTTRVAHESEQCLRYELGGTPLPFARDTIFDKLFPSSGSDTTTISKAAFKVSPPIKRTYTPSSSLIPPCPICKNTRVYECQLMPNLINVLHTSDSRDRKETEAERRKALELALKGGDGMSWGTCLIFSCAKNCCISGDQGRQAKECWREEFVLTQWDN